MYLFQSLRFVLSTAFQLLHRYDEHAAAQWHAVLAYQAFRSHAVDPAVLDALWVCWKLLNSHCVTCFPDIILYSLSFRAHRGASTTVVCISRTTSKSSEILYVFITDVFRFVIKLSLITACLWTQMPRRAGALVVAIVCEEYGQTWWPHWGPWSTATGAYV